MTWLNLVKRVATLFLERPKAADVPGAVPVGTGASNERQFIVNGIPHLLRDEGHRIVHFAPSFDHRIEPTAYGEKLLPDVVPRWVPVGIHAGAKMEIVAAGVVKNAGLGDASPAWLPESKGTSAPVRRVSQLSEETPPSRNAAGPQDSGTGATSVRKQFSPTTVGSLLEWGEMEFPNRKTRGPSTYRSFAVKLSTAEGEQTLQGEGLKDAIAEARCQLGDRVVVKRLHKVKVPAFDQKTGRPIMDRETGEQKLWDKWTWSINHIH